MSYLLTVGLTARELAMQCDFYECADLIDDLEKIQIEEEKEQLRQSRIKGDNIVFALLL